MEIPPDARESGKVRGASRRRFSRKKACCLLPGSRTIVKLRKARCFIEDRAIYGSEDVRQPAPSFNSTHR